MAYQAKLLADIEHNGSLAFYKSVFIKHNVTICVTIDGVWIVEWIY
jgi:hypothetical protein